MNRFFKKIAAGAMCAMMMASMIPATIAANAATSEMPIIDRSQDGKASLTITKYEIEDKDVYGNLSHYGTGEKETMKADGGNIPNEAVPFEGVTFTAYQIANIDTLGLYLEDGKAIPTADTVTESMLASATPITATTDSNGIARFENLKLGIYYVKETSAPPQVLEHCAPFTVSVPTTSDSGDKWLYDVYAYPKNETQYADVTMHKVDGMNNNRGLAGAGFTLEKSLNGTSDWSFVGSRDACITNNNGDFTWTHLPVNVHYRIQEVSAPDNKYICNNDDYITFTLDSTGAVQNLNSNSLTFDTSVESKNDATNIITMANDYVTVDKFVVRNNTNMKHATVKIDERVTWNIRASVPAEMSKMKTYMITDTMGTGLSFNEVGMVVSGLGNTGSQINTFEKTKDYTVSKVNSSVVTISFTTAGCKKAANLKVATISVTYLTDVTKDAPLGKAIENKPNVTYTNNFKTDSTYTTPDITDIPEVHTSGYQLKKVKKDGTALTGVTFKLFATKADADKLQNALEFYTYDSNGNVVKTTEAVSGADGLVSFLGLAYGTDGNTVTQGSTKYYIVETSTQEGYNLLKDPVEINVTHNSYDYNNTHKNIVNVAKIPLPPTGVMAGIGTLGIGLIFLAVGFGFSMAKKRKKTVK